MSLLLLYVYLPLREITWTCRPAGEASGELIVQVLLHVNYCLSIIVVLLFICWYCASWTAIESRRYMVQCSAIFFITGCYSNGSFSPHRCDVTPPLRAIVCVCLNNDLHWFVVCKPGSTKTKLQISVLIIWTQVWTVLRMVQLKKFTVADSLLNNHWLVH